MKRMNRAQAEAEGRKPLFHFMREAGCRLVVTETWILPDEFDLASQEIEEEWKQYRQEAGPLVPASPWLIPLSQQAKVVGVSS